MTIIDNKEAFEKTKKINFCKKCINLKNFNIFIFSLIILSIFYYMAGINNLMVKGFKLKDLKQEIVKLQEENMEYNIKRTSLESYSNLSRRASELNMVYAGEIEYITTSSELAKR